jgi:hypothetical protein
MNVATPPTTWVDTGAIAANCDRGVPVANTTRNTNTITITYPGATPIVPVGYTWKIYRTYVANSWQNSLLHYVVETISISSTVIVPFYVDNGQSTQVGQPPTFSYAASSPDQVLLTDAAEVQGTLPMGNTSFPMEVTFDFPGDFSIPTTGIAIWMCEFPAATIIGCRASLGVNKSASGFVQVDVNKGTSSATPTFSTIYTTQGNRPAINSGQSRGSRTVPDIKSLVVGESLSVDIDAIGGATPLISYLTVTVYMIAHGYPTTSFVPGTTTGT